MSPSAIEKINDIYLVNTRVFLVSKTTTPYIRPMSKGLVKRVDDKGLVHVNWDNEETTTLDIRKDLFYKL